MKNKLISLILAAALALSLFACGGNEPAEHTTGASDTSSADTTTGTGTEETGPVLNIEPEDNGGAEYRILTTNYAANEYAVEEQTGDIINDAVYRRNMAVEELLGIKFSYIIGTTSAGADKEAIELNKLIQTSVSANEDAYDLICSTVVRTLPAAVNGYFVDINATSIDLSNPWWITTLSDEISINGKLFGVMGDLSLSLYRDISVIYFNKALFEDYKLENPYELVRQGTWTLDKYLTLAQNGEQDVDGNGEIDPAIDHLWSVGQMVPNRAFLTSCNIRLMERDDDSIKLLTLPEILVDVNNKLYPFFNSDYTYVDPTGDHQLYAGYFASGRALFMNSYLYQTDYLRDMKDDFGIVPYPKLNEQQESYYSQLGTSATMNFIPVTSAKVDLTAKVLEALAYHGQQEVVPAYYEFALKTKYARDEDVQEMLDIVRDGASMNFLFAHSLSFSYPFLNVILNYKPGDTMYENLASWYDSRIAGWNTQLETLIEGYTD